MLESTITAPVSPSLIVHQSAIDIETTEIVQPVLSNTLDNRSVASTAVVIKTEPPTSILELFWYVLNQIWHRVRLVLTQGVNAWVEAFSHLSATQGLEELANSHTGAIKQVQRITNTVLFGLKPHDIEAALIDSRVMKRSFQTVTPSVKNSTQRDSWLSNNQWSGLDTLFPAKDTRHITPQSVPTTSNINQQIPETDIVEGVVIALPARSSQETTQNILTALQEAYIATPISEIEEIALQQHPLSQRGRAVKQSINQLVDTYFAQEQDSTVAPLA
jgi:hypothetical protein